MKYPYPIKNWRQCDEYPSGGNYLDTEEWAWEFTRRNADYQKHWDVFKSLPDSCPEVGIKNGKWKGSPGLDQHLDSYSGYVNPPPLPNETRVEYEQRNSESGYCIEPYQDYFTRLFGVRPTDPREDDFTNVILYLNEHEGSVQLPFDAFHREEKKNQFGENCVSFEALVPEHIVIPDCLMFDLSRDLDQQLKQARAMLKDRQKFYREVGRIDKLSRRSGLHMDTFPRLLRVLDAHAELSCAGRRGKDIWLEIGSIIHSSKAPERAAESAKEDFDKAAGVRLALISPWGK